MNRFAKGSTSSGDPHTLELLLKQWSGWSVALKETGHIADAKLIERFCSQVATATEEYRRWLSEPEAMLQSGRTKAWLRSQHPHWEAAGHARREGKDRLYRMIVIPTRGAAQRSFEAGRRAAEGRAA